jgi:hypothetical protein
MSGRKQHYIPQVLLRGFSANPDAKAPTIFVYSRDRGFYRTNTKDTAAEREFYSAVNPGSVTLDDDITAYENILSGQLGVLKASGVNLVDGTLAASVIVHLAIRNDHTRKAFTQTAGQLISGLRDMLTDLPTVRDLVGVDKPTRNSKIKQEIRKELRERNPGLTRRVEFQARAYIGHRESHSDSDIVELRRQCALDLMQYGC